MSLYPAITHNALDNWLSVKLPLVLSWFDILRAWNSFRREVNSLSLRNTELKNLTLAAVNLCPAFHSTDYIPVYSIINVIRLVYCFPCKKLSTIYRWIHLYGVRFSPPLLEVHQIGESIGDKLALGELFYSFFFSCFNF